MTSTQTKLTFAKRILGALTTLVLVACGGGGGGAGSGGGFLPDNNGTPTPSYTLTVSGKSAGGTATNEFSASSPLTIEVLVEDTSTNTASVVSGAVVELESTVGTITPANASALTNASGIAEFTLGFNQEEGAGTVTASYVVDGTTYSGTFNVQSIVEPTNEPVITLSLAATNSTGDTVTTLSQRSPATLTASFLSTLDGAATPISGELVTITTNVGDVSPSNNTALTDVNGDAVFTVSFNGTEGAGSVDVTASLDGVAYTDTLNLQAQDTGAPYEISIQIVNESDVQTNVLSSSQPLTVQALVRRIDGGLFIPVGAGESVQLTTTLGSIAGNGSALTNAQGIATFDITFDGTVGAGSVTASYDSADGAVAKTSNIQSVATAIGYALDLVAIPSVGMDANTFAQGAPITLRATLSSSTSSVANQAIAVNTNVGRVSPANGVTLTGADGVAVFEVAFNDIIGAGVATATFNPTGAAIVASVNLEAVVADPTAGLEVSTFADDGSVTTEFAVGSPMTVRVQLTDGVGAAALKAGEIINLSSSIGTLNAASKLTDSNGIATFELRSEGVVGAGTLEATYQTALGLVRAQQTVQSIASEPYVLDLVAAGGPMTLGQDILLTATLTAPNGGAAAGQILNIATDLGVLDKASAVTDGSGKAVFTLSYNDVVGAGVVTVSFTSGSETFTSSAVVEAESPTAPSLAPVVQDQAGVATRTLSSVEDLVFEVAVRDRQGNLVGAGEVVFASTSIGTMVGNGSALTDEFGVARFTLQHDGTVGAGVLTASYSLDGQTVSVQRTVESVATNQNYTLTLDAAVDGANFSALSDLVVNVTLASTTGAEVANQAITLTSDIGSVAGNGRALTNGAGVASFVVSYNDILGAGTVTASFTTNDGTLTDSANVEAVDVSNNFGLDFNLSDASGSFSLAEPLTVRVQLTDGQGDPLATPGEIINLSSSIGNLDAGSKLTDASGIATFVLSSTGAIGAGTLEATYGSDLGVIRAQQTVQSVSTTPYIITVTSAGGPMTLGQDITITVNLQQPNGSPAVGEIITIQSTLGSVAPSSAVTDVDGKAVFTLSYADVAGAGVVTVSYDSGTETFSNTVTVESVAPLEPRVVLSLLTELGQTTRTLTSSSDLTVEVEVRDRSGALVGAGETVNVSSTIGSIVGNGASLTNDQGIATFTLRHDGDVGAGVVTATYTSGVQTVTAQSTVESVVTDQNYTLLIDPAIEGASFSAANALTVRVTLSSDTGASVSNQSITLSSDIGLVAGNGRALTDANGVALFELQYAGVLGAGTITATYAADGGSVVASSNVVSIDAGNAYGLQIGLSDVSGNFSLTTPMTVSVQLTDGSGNALAESGEIIGLSTTIGSLDATSKLTDSNGVATFELSSTGDIGAGIVEATYDIGLGVIRAQKAVESVSTSPYKLGIRDVTGSGTALTVGTPRTYEISLGTPDVPGPSEAAEGEVVNVSSTIGQLDKTSVLIDSSGRAVVTLTHNDTVGIGVITVSFTANGETFTNSINVESVAARLPTINILTSVNGDTTSSFNVLETLEVTVTVEGTADYGVVAGDTVSLSSTIGTVADNGAALLVDNAGNLEATFTVTSDGEFGVGTLTATVNVGGQQFEESVSVSILSLKLEASIVNSDSTPKDLGDTLVISSIDPYRENTVTYTLTNSQGQRLSGELVQVTTNKGILTPTDGYILTDDQGEATVTLSYSDTITAGPGTLTATHVALGGQVSRENLIQVVGPNEVAENNAAVRVGYLNLPDPLPAGYDTSTIESFLEGRIRLTPSDGVIVNEGSITLEVDVVLTDGVATASVDDRVNTVQKVLIESDCISAGDASLSPANPVSTSNGVASVVYKAGPGCVGEDQISATLLFGSDKTSEVAIDVVTVSQAGKEKSIRYVTSSVNSLALRGTEGLTDLPEKTLIQFQVVDANGGPLSGEIVELNTTSKLGGLTLTVTDANNISGADYVTDSEGLITVELASGVVATQTRVSAKLTETGEVAFSEVIAISTSIPDDDSVTVAISEYSVAEGLSDVTRGTTLTVRLADRFNNPVPAGYFVYFTTEYGAIPASCEIQIDDVGQSFCQVEWRVGQPLPDTVAAQDLSDVYCPNYVSASVATYDPCPSVLGISEVSRNTVLVTVTGEESFVDNDGDGLFSAGDTLIVEVGEPFLDANYNDAHDPGEEFIDENGDGLYDSDLDPGFTGIACDPDSGCVADTITLYRNVEFILSAGGEYYIAVVNGGQQLDPSADPVVSGTTYDFYISDRFNNWPASGSSVEITATGECEITSESTFVIPNSPAERAYQNRFRVGGAVNDPDTTDSVKLRITDAAGVTGSVSFACTP